MNSRYIDWGLTRYDEAFEKQQRVVNSRIGQEIADALIFTEHYPVYTLGKRKGTLDHLIWDEGTLKLQGIELAYTNRGGDITYHGPGQIVGYPIISLSETRDLHAYLRKLEQVLINTLALYKMEAERKEGKTGIWIGDRKIAAIGVAVKRWVTYHGFALNVMNNLDHFNGIVPCGIPASEGSVTSMHNELKQAGRDLDLESIKASIAIEFWKVFDNE